MGRQFKKKANKKGNASKASKGSHKSHEHKKERKETKKTSPKTKAKRNISSPRENFPKNENYTIVKENMKTSEEKDELPPCPQTVQKNINASLAQTLSPAPLSKMVNTVTTVQNPLDSLETLLTLVQMFSFVTFLLEMVLLPLIIYYTYPYLYFERFIGMAYYIYLILPILTIFISLFFLPTLAYSIICLRLEKMTVLHKSIIKVNAFIQYYILLSFLFVGIMFLTFNLYHDPDSFGEAIEASIVESRRGRVDIHKLQSEMKCCGTRVKGFKFHDIAVNYDENPLNAWYKHYNMTDYYIYGSEISHMKDRDTSTYPFAFNGVPASCCNFNQVFPECGHIFSLEVAPTFFSRISRETSLQIHVLRYDRTASSLNEYDCSYALTDGMKSIMFVIGCLCLLFAFLHTACAIVTSLLTNELNRKHLGEKEKEIETPNTHKLGDALTDHRTLKRENTISQMVSNVHEMAKTTQHTQLKEQSAVVDEVKGYDAFAAKNLLTNNINDFVDDDKILRKPVQKVYFWPSLTDGEKGILREAFHQIARRTCIKFQEEEYKPWYHADRWDSKHPYVLIRKSGKYAAYSDNSLEGLVDRTILYISSNAFNQENHNNTRGAVMDQLVRFMGLKREIYRPDAESFIAPLYQSMKRKESTFHPIQLQWPFDPESITIPVWARERYRLTQYCPGRNDPDIGAGQRVGLLTRWDTIKLNSMYCPNQIDEADPRRGPCVVPRAKDLDEFNRRVFAYKRLLTKDKRSRN